MRYQDIVFLQGEDAVQALGILESEGEQAAIGFMKLWDYGDNNCDISDKAGGTSDIVYKDDKYIMSYNTRLGYIGLCKEVEEIPVVSYDKRFRKIP